MFLQLPLHFYSSYHKVVLEIFPAARRHGVTSKKTRRSLLGYGLKKGRVF